MSDLIIFNSGTKIISGTLMMSSQSLAVMCGDKEHREFVRDVKKLYNITSVENTHSVDIAGVFFELHEQGNNKGRIKEIWFDKTNASAIAGIYSFEYNLKVHGFFVEKQNLESIESNNSTHALNEVSKNMLELGKMFGLEGNQLLLNADKAVKKLLNVSPLALLGLELKSENNEKLFTPTEIGQQFQMSAIAINLILNKMGLQNQIENKKGHKTWVLTEKGKEFGIYLDTGKAHSNGTPIQQIKWKESVIAELKP